jgi:uncharacterized protein YndB with AHSA1/START domain
MTWTQKTSSWPMPVTPAAVFAALTDAAQLRTWFAEHAEVEPRVGGAYRFWGRHTPGVPSAAEAAQRITALEPDARLGFTWTVLGVPSSVAITIAAVDGKGTTITAEQTLEGPLGVPREKELIDDFWKLSFGNLSVHLGSGTGFLRPDFADPSPEIRLSIVVAAPPAAVFRTLVEPELINKWVGSDKARVEPRVGGVYSFGWSYELDGTQVEGGPMRILEIDPDRKLVVDWPDWRGDATVTGQSVSFTLHPEGTGTRVDLVHAGFTRPTDISDYPFGWGHFLGEIQKVTVEAART